MVTKIRKELYVDDLISRSTTVSKTRELMDKAIAIFEDAWFTLHKWHSNVPKLEEPEQASADEEPTYVKEQLGIPQGGFSSILGLPWRKERDTLSVPIPVEKATKTKRGILAKLAFLSPVSLQGKLLYRAVYDMKSTWDADLASDIAKLWEVGSRNALQRRTAKISGHVQGRDNED